MKLPVLPVYYYLDHFEEMLSFVEKTYGSVLTAEHHDFIARFNGFSKTRNVCSSGWSTGAAASSIATLFRYAEISDIDRAIAELTAHGHIRELAKGLRILCRLPSEGCTAGGAKTAGLPTSASPGRSRS